MIKDDTIRSPASRFSARSRRRHRQLAAGYLINYSFYNVHRNQLLIYSVLVSSLGQLEIGLAVLRRRLYFAIVHALGIRCELV